jgi:DNA-binding SARP family transcriptional activator
MKKRNGFSRNNIVDKVANSVTTLFTDFSFCRGIAKTASIATLAYYISKTGMENLAQAYEQNGYRQEAIQAYTWLSNYLPLHFKPKFNLFKLYRENGDTAQMAKQAEWLLQTKPKISSVEIEEIKQEVKNIINNYESKQ